MLVVACPGQGSQTPGMLSPWLEDPNLDSAFSQLLAASQTAVDLRHLGTAADAEEIRDTGVAQPLIVASSLLAWEAVTAQLGSTTAELLPNVVAGHSVGELAAAAVAGAISPATAVSLVSVRGQAMAKAAAEAQTGMAAVVGGNSDEVWAAIQNAGLTPANVNSASQVVAAGSLEQIEFLVANPPAKARVVPLQVAGAFHTSYMASAQETFASAVAQASFTAPRATLLSNADGQAFQLAGVGGEHQDQTVAGQVASRLVSQLTNPVRWDLCQQSLRDLGVTALLELAPGGVLAGLAKRELKGIEIVAIKSPADLEAAADLVRNHLDTTFTQSTPEDK